MPKKKNKKISIELISYGFFQFDKNFVFKKKEIKNKCLTKNENN